MFKRCDCSSVSLLSALLAPGMACDSLLGQIQFGPAREVTSGMGAHTAIILDTNADGLNDLLLAGYSGFGTRINLGGGRFVQGEPRQTVRGGMGAIAHGDIDGDERPDLVWVTEIDWWPQRFDWWLSSTNVVRSFEPGGRGSRLAVADFDRDGDGDALCADLTDYVSIGAYLRLLEYRDGQFQVAWESPLPFNASFDMVVSDFNSDGWPDAAVLGLRGDLDEWGWIVYDTGVAIYLNDRTGTLQQAAYLTFGLRDSYTPAQIAAGDLDGDGHVDLVAGINSNFSRYNGKVHALINDGTGRIFQIQPAIELQGLEASIVVGDFDTDGRLDLAVGSGRFIEAHRSIGQGRFTLDSLNSIPAYTQWLAAGDLTGQGTLDLSFISYVYGAYAMPNLTPYSGPELLQSDLVRGRRAGIGVRGAGPHETVHFLFSLEGEGHSVGQPLLGGMTLNLLHPIMYIGSARADAQGRAGLVLHIPPGAPRGTVTTQAVMRRGLNGEDSVKTPFHTAPILDP